MRATAQQINRLELARAEYLDRVVELRMDGQGIRCRVTNAELNDFEPWVVMLQLATFSGDQIWVELDEVRLVEMAP